MAEMKIGNGPLKLTLTDDKGRVVAALRYPRVKWKTLLIDSEDAEFDAVVLDPKRVRLEKRVPGAEASADEGEEASNGKPDWDPFREFEFGVRDLLTKTGKAVEDFLENLNEWSGPLSHD